MKTKVFSGMGALIGALAGLVTVGVGVITIGSQTGWFGIQKSDDVGSSRVTPGASGSAATAPPEFEVDKREIDFGLLSEEAEVELENTGEVPFSVERPVVQGSGAFRAEDVDCLDAPLSRGDTCTIRVVVTQPGSHQGTLEIPIGDDEAQVALNATL